MPWHIDRIVEKTSPPAINMITKRKRECHATIVEIAIKVKVNNS